MGSVCEHRGGKVAVAGVGQQDDDALALILGTLGEPGGGPHCRAGGDADEQTLLARQLAAGAGVRFALRLAVYRMMGVIG